jgi:hypothetical protein
VDRRAVRPVVIVMAVAAAALDRIPACGGPARAIQILSRRRPRAHPASAARRRTRRTQAEHAHYFSATT